MPLTKPKNQIMRKTVLTMLVLLLAMVQGTWAQSAFGNVPETVDAADVDGNGTVNIADVAALVNILSGK